MHIPKPFADALYASGQPAPDDLAQLVAAGVQTVINLRAASEPAEYDEAREVERLGLRYVTIPVAGALDLTSDTVARFSQELEQARIHGGVLLHCASGNRVGAMIALDAGLTRREPAEQALSLGRAAGLTSLEAVVARLLADTQRTAAARASSN